MLSACQTVADSDRARAYGNIAVSRETTDAGGIEVEVREDGTGAKVFIVVCEGGCHGAEGSDIVYDNATLSVLRRDPLEPSAIPERFVFRRSGAKLIVQAPDWAKGQVLRRTRAGRTREWARYH